MGTIWQESFYFDLTEEELKHVHEYNFDHPGKTILFEQFESMVMLVTQTFLFCKLLIVSLITNNWVYSLAEFHGVYLWLVWFVASVMIYFIFFLPKFHLMNAQRLFLVCEFRNLEEEFVQISCLINISSMPITLL